MTSPRLYAFFVTDDTARTKAFLWSTLVGGMLGAFASLFVAQLLAALATIAASTATLSIFTAKYSLEHESPNSDEEPIKRRRILALTVLPVAETAVSTIATLVLGNLSSAVSYAKAAADAIRSDRKPSPIRVLIAKQVIEAKLRTSPVRPSPLAMAYAELLAAEASFRIPDIPRENQSSTLIYLGQPNGPLIIVDGKNDLILGLTLKSGLGPTVFPVCIEVTKSATLMVRGCTIEHFRQVLDDIVWFDVAFKNCIIESKLENVVMVNVSFKDCVFVRSLEGILPGQRFTPGAPVTGSIGGLS